MNFKFLTIFLSGLVLGSLTTYGIMFLTRNQKLDDIEFHEEGEEEEQIQEEEKEEEQRNTGQDQGGWGVWCTCGFEPKHMARTGVHY